MPVAAKTSATVAAIILSASLGAVVCFAKPPDREGDVCSTKGCINAAARILNSMNTSVDPCEDFFRYACGGWIDTHPLPDDRAFLAVHHFLGNNNKETLQDALESDDTGDRDAIKKMKRFYKLCMDEEGVENLGARPALDFIRRLGGMPLFGDEFDEANFSLENALPESLSSPIVGIGVVTDYQNTSRRVIAMAQPSLGMPVREYYIESRFNKTLLAYRRYMEDVLTALWKNKDEMVEGGKTTYNQKTLKSAVDEIIRFETELAGVLLPESERADYTSQYRKFTLEEMPKEVTAEYNWYEYVKKMMEKVDYTVTPSTEVVLYGTKYLKKFMSVVKKYDNRILKNYIIWRDIHTRVGNMPKSYRDIAATYRKATQGISKEEARLKMCVEDTKTAFEMPLGALFVERLFSKGSKLQVKEMMGLVVQYLRRNIKRLAWMDKATVEKALLKIDSLGELLAYPDYIIDEEDPRLDEEFEDLNIPDNDYYTSRVNLAYFLSLKRGRKISEPVERFDWGSVGPATVNAYYSSPRNLLIFPAGFIQAPYFDENQPYAMNYGGIGSAIGHEMTHGFDVEGSRLNEKGELENWWSNFSKKHFEENAQCVRDQYSGFYYDLAEMFVNGNLTISENIADMAGVRLAYGGYRLWKKRSGKTDFKLPGLEHFSYEQLYFIAFGQFWCGSETKEQAQRVIKLDVHSPLMFRANGALMNFKKFGKAFGCKKGEDKMFPLRKNTCKVW